MLYLFKPLNCFLNYAENMTHAYDYRNYLNINMFLKRVALLTSNGPINETE